MKITNKHSLLIYPLIYILITGTVSGCGSEPEVIYSTETSRAVLPEQEETESTEYTDVFEDTTPDPAAPGQIQDESGNTGSTEEGTATAESVESDSHSEEEGLLTEEKQNHAAIPADSEIATEKNSSSVTGTIDGKSALLGAAAGATAASMLQKDSEQTAAESEAEMPDTSSEQVDVLQSENTAETAQPEVIPDSGGGDSNFNTYDFQERKDTEETYILNTNSKKIHHPYCTSVPKISPENYAETSLSISELEAQGYTKCGQKGDWN